MWSNSQIEMCNKCELLIKYSGIPFYVLFSLLSCLLTRRTSRVALLSSMAVVLRYALYVLPAGSHQVELIWLGE